MAASLLARQAVRPHLMAAGGGGGGGGGAGTGSACLKHKLVSACVAASGAAGQRRAGRVC